MSKQTVQTRASEYIVAKNPTTKLWTVAGYVGRNHTGHKQYIPVSDGFQLKSDAVKYIPHIKLAIATATAEISI